MSIADPDGLFGKAVDFIMKKGFETAGKSSYDKDPIAEIAIESAYNNQAYREIQNGVDPTEAQQRYESKMKDAHQKMQTPDPRSWAERQKDIFWKPFKDKWFTPKPCP